MSSRLRGLPPTGWGAWALVALACALATGCEPGSIEVVGSPGGVYRPGQGCTLVPGAPVCPGPGDPHPQLQFESDGPTGIITDTAPGTLSNLRVTCVRSYCGSGSLQADSTLQWVDNTSASDPTRMASYSHVFDAPVDLMGRTIGFSVYADHLGVPMHAQIGVIFQYWRWVGWVPLAAGWNRIQGVVSPANPLTEIDASVTSIPVTELRMDVYVPVADASGTQGSWSGEIFLDDVSW